MRLQEQLGQPQKPAAFPHFLMFEAREEGFLGNKSIQTPTEVADTGKAFRTRHVGRPAAVANAESAEMAWLVQNAPELSQHKGEWLLIQGAQLLVHSHDFAAVRAAVTERQIQSPFVYYVPTDDESNSVTI